MRTGIPLTEMFPGAIRICPPNPPAFFFTDATYGTGARVLRVEDDDDRRQRENRDE